MTIKYLSGVIIIIKTSQCIQKIAFIKNLFMSWITRSFRQVYFDCIENPTNGFFRL